MEVTTGQTNCVIWSLIHNIYEERNKHAYPAYCVNTLRPAEETWFDQGKDGETNAWMAYTVLLKLFFCNSYRIIRISQSERLAFAQRNSLKNSERYT